MWGIYFNGTRGLHKVAGEVLHCKYLTGVQSLIFYLLFMMIINKLEGVHTSSVALLGPGEGL